MSKIRSWLNFEEGTTQDELQEGLKGLTLASLRILCKEEKVKSSGTKAELIGRLVSNWKLKFNFGEESMDDPSDGRPLTKCSPHTRSWVDGSHFRPEAPTCEIA